MKKLSIHIVEDEIIIALDLEDILEGMGHHVDISCTIEDAMARAEAHITDLFLIDIQLNGADSGLELGRELQQRNIPHIYISAYTDAKTRGLAQSTASLGYLNKPFDEQEFQELLQGAAGKIEKRPKSPVTKS